MLFFFKTKGNEIGEAGAIAFSELLSVNTTLDELNLECKDSLFFGE